MFENDSINHDMFANCLLRYFRHLENYSRRQMCLRMAVLILFPSPPFHPELVNIFNASFVLEGIVVFSELLISQR